MVLGSESRTRTGFYDANAERATRDPAATDATSGRMENGGESE